MKKISLLFLGLLFGVFVSNGQNDSLDFEFSDEEQLLLEQAFANMFGSDIDVADSYDFNYSYKIKIESLEYDEKISEELEIFLNLDDKSMSVSTSMEQDGKEMDMTMIYLWETKEMINLSEYDGEKFGMAMKIPDLEEMGLGMDEDAEKNKQEWKKTGSPEMIAGHKCQEYVSKSDVETIKVWISLEKNVIPTEAFLAYSEVNGIASNQEDMPAEGTIMKMWSQYDGAEGFESFEVVEINPKNKTSISTTGYEFDLMNLGK